MLDPQRRFVPGLTPTTDPGAVQGSLTETVVVVMAKEDGDP